jgi:hypothetical protein
MEVTMTNDETLRNPNDHSVSDKPGQLKQQEQGEQQSQAMKAVRPNPQAAPGRRPLFGK